MDSSPERHIMVRTLRVGVFGHVGRENLGDESLIASVIQNVRRRRPDALIYGFTLEPEDTTRRHGIPSFPIRPVVVPRAAAGSGTGPSAVGRPGASDSALRRLLKPLPLVTGAWRGLRDASEWLRDVVGQIALVTRSRRLLRGIDLLVIAGSAQVSDYFGGPWGFPFTVVTWVAAARLAGVRVAFVSVGAGPLQAGLSKRFLRWALLLAHYKSFRDESSRRLTESMGVRVCDGVYPDLVHSVEFPPAAERPHRVRPVVGVNPLPFFDSRYWAEWSEDVYTRYVETLARFCLRLIESGGDVFLFPTQLRADPPVMRDVEVVMKREGRPGWERHLGQQPVDGFDGLVAAIRTSDVVVASRFHGVVIPAALGVPVLGISYQPKCDDLMRSIGLGDYFVDIRTMTVEDLLARFHALAASAPAVREQLARTRREFRAALDVQYDRVLALASARSH